MAAPPSASLLFRHRQQPRLQLAIAFYKPGELIESVSSEEFLTYLNALPSAFPGRIVDLPAIEATKPAIGSVPFFGKHYRVVDFSVSTPPDTTREAPEAELIYCRDYVVVIDQHALVFRFIFEAEPEQKSPIPSLSSAFDELVSTAWLNE